MTCGRWLYSLIPINLGFFIKKMLFYGKAFLIIYLYSQCNIRARPQQLLLAHYSYDL